LTADPTIYLLHPSRDRTRAGTPLGGQQSRGCEPPHR
jgi:hypothetical protein